MKRPLRLKTLFAGFTIFLLAVVLILSIALSLMTTDMHRDAKTVRLGLSSVRAAQTLKIDVLEFARFNYLYFLTADRKYLQRSDEKEREIRDWLARSKTIEAGSLAQDAVGVARLRTSDYIAAIKESRSNGEHGKAGDLLAKALDALNVLVQDNVQRADKALAASARLDQYGDDIAYTNLALFLIATIVVSIAASRYIYRPLLSIHAAILDFTNGNLSSRAPLVGVSELTYLASAFNSMVAQLISSNQRKTQFLAGTAHDLKNPLSALQMTIQMLRNDSENLTVEQRGKLELMARQVARLDNLSSSFLDAIQIESGEFGLNLRRVDLTRLVKDAIELWSVMTEKHRFVTRIPSEPIVAVCDPVRIGQVITNLISNAVKYSPDGGLVEVELRKLGNKAQISTRDYGIGIHPSEVEKIFEPFHRSPPAQQLLPGVGIGLWITKRLVEAHSGTIAVDSQTGMGATFIVELPLTPPLAKNHLVSNYQNLHELH